MVILGLNSVGVLLSSSKWSPFTGLGGRGWSRAMGLRCGGSAMSDRFTGGVRFFHGLRTRRETLDSVTFRAAAADEVEQEEEVEEEETQPETAFSSQRDRQLSPRERSEISRIEQRKQRASSRKPAGNRSSRILSSIVEEWTSFTSKRENGDIRDVVLMSLSFAVLIYISQHLVHAYCALRHMYFHHY